MKQFHLFLIYWVIFKHYLKNNIHLWNLLTLANFRFRVVCIIATETLHLQCCNKIIAEIVTSTGSKPQCNKILNYATCISSKMSSISFMYIKVWICNLTRVFMQFHLDCFRQGSFVPFAAPSLSCKLASKYTKATCFNSHNILCQSHTSWNVFHDKLTTKMLKKTQPKTLENIGVWLLILIIH